MSGALPQAMARVRGVPRPGGRRPGLASRRHLLPALAMVLLGFPAGSFAQASPEPISFGAAAVALNGPWKFHSGDDLAWAQPDFEDGAWESVDLTPLPGAHDGDVGLTGYAPGWSARGHRGYSGFAWYRLRVRVLDTGEAALWLAGPALVDNAYELYVNGHLLGSSAQLSQGTPALRSVRPRLFMLPRSLWDVRGTQLHALLAIRVLCGICGGADGGGIHIAPVLGNEAGVRAHYRLQWLEKVEGYLVDAVQPVFFVLLALMALCSVPFDRGQKFNLWITAVLILLAAARLNQPLFWLGHFETLREFVLWRLALVDGLTLGAWLMAWRAAFGLSRPRWLVPACAALCAGYILARALSTPIVLPGLGAAVSGAFASLAKFLRLGFLGLLLLLVWQGCRARRASWAMLLSILLGSVGLFAPELGQIGVPGIWFPFGVGVSRTEYAYAAFDVTLFIYLLQRLWRFVPARPVPQEDAGRL